MTKYFNLFCENEYFLLVWCIFTFARWTFLASSFGWYERYFTFQIRNIWRFLWLSTISIYSSYERDLIISLCKLEYCRFFSLFLVYDVTAGVSRTFHNFSTIMEFLKNIAKLNARFIMFSLLNFCTICWKTKSGNSLKKKEVKRHKIWRKFHFREYFCHVAVPHSSMKN